MQAHRGARAFLPLALAVVSALALSPSAGALTGPSVLHGTTPAFNVDAPDPHVLRVGTTYYAYTTGTTWGNHIGILTSTSPDSGWHTLTGTQWGSSAFPALGPSTAPARWQVNNTSVAPGVFVRNGVWIMYYAAQSRVSHQWCLSVATATSPGGPFTDRTGSTPFLCMDAFGGAVDPQPYVDPDGIPRVLFKTNTGTVAQPARLWSLRLDSSGLHTTTEWPHVLLSQDTVKYPWETTIENPQMFYRNGTRWLLFSVGRWDSANYAESSAKCSGPNGGCTQASAPFLTKYSTVLGPGGATAFPDASGHWYLAFHAWASPCTSYACGGKRRLFVQPLQLP